jgi:hypothetical protein
MRRLFVLLHWPRRPCKARKGLQIIDCGPHPLFSMRSCPLLIKVYQRNC